jgi:hypothetical protein
MKIVESSLKIGQKSVKMVQKWSKCGHNGSKVLGKLVRRWTKVIKNGRKYNFQKERKWSILGLQVMIETVQKWLALKMVE